MGWSCPRTQYGHSSDMGVPHVNLRWLFRPTLGSQDARADAKAFEAAYRRHHQALYRYSVSILHDEQDAQDALQSAMTRAFAALRAERRDFELRPWLFRIVHNEAVSMLRPRRPPQPLEGLPQTGASVEERAAMGAELATLRADLEALPDHQRAALVLRELNGLGHREIAQALDLTPALVKQQIFQARTALMQAREGREMACADIRRAL